MGNALRITLVTRGSGDMELLSIRLQSKGHQVVVLSRPSVVLGLVYSDPPDIIMLDLLKPDDELLGLVRSLRDDCYFSTIPLIGLTDGTDTDWTGCPVDDFIAAPINYQELFSRIHLSMERIQRVFDNNPLTRLPGNPSIQRAIEKVIGQPMAVCYVDINHFKPYNDVFGFSHGDEVLRMLGRVMANAVKESGGRFAGHIGGDDFVFIVAKEQVEPVCTTIIDHFDRVVSDLFDEQQKHNGYYSAKNRAGHLEQVPLLGISIAVVYTDRPGIIHYGKVAEVAAELKKKAKKAGKSCFVCDQRRYATPPLHAVR